MIRRPAGLADDQTYYFTRLLGDSRLDSHYLLNEQYTLNSDGRGVGTDWTAEYTVARSRREIAGVLRCPWAECTESMAKT